MSLPPDDDNPNNVDNLFGQISKELQESGLVDDEIRDELLHGIQESLQALLGDVFEMDTPNVTVVEGGKKEDEPPSDHPRPDLKVAQFSEEESGGNDSNAFSFDSPNVAVRFVRPSTKAIHSVVSGNIHVCSTNETQHLYIGEKTRMYRLLLFKGSAEIILGKDVFGVISEKQSVDLEGRQISIRSLCDEVSGTYSLIDKKQ